MYFKLMTLVLLFYTVQLKAQYERPVNSDLPGDCWNFEQPDAPTANQVQKKRSDKCMATGSGIRFSDGICTILPDSGHPGSIESSSSALTGMEQTFWIRFLLGQEGIEGQPTRPSPGLLRVGNIWINIFTELNAGNQLLYGLKAAYIGRGGRTEATPAPYAGIHFNAWVQLAITRSVENGSGVYRCFFREENAKLHLINWVYIGKIETQEQGNNSKIVIGNIDNSTLLPYKVCIDEIRCYNRSLSDTALLKIWPALRGFSHYPGQPYGTVIDYSPAFTGKYVGGSPSVALLSDGSYVVKEDYYGPAVGRSELACIYRSEDRGSTWKKISEVEGITWATLFTHKGMLYMMGTSAGHGLGHAIIIRSTDGGHTWTKPADAAHGLIFSDLSYHTAPVPVIIHNGRIWRAMEDEKGGGGWGRNFRVLMLSAPVDADLLNAHSWSVSAPLPSSTQWLGGSFNGWLEGNAVVDPQGSILDILRVSAAGVDNKAAIVRFNASGKTGSFDPQKSFIEFPGGSTKFHILFDTVSRRYWALSNPVLNKHRSGLTDESFIRNTLVLMCSENLKNWRIIDTILYHPDVAKHAFQYPSFVFDGNDIVFVCRTAYDDPFGGASRQHDVNYFTFHRIRDFRKLASRL